MSSHKASHDYTNTGRKKRTRSGMRENVSYFPGQIHNFATTLNLFRQTQVTWPQLNVSTSLKDGLSDATCSPFYHRAPAPRLALMTSRRARSEEKPAVTTTGSWEKRETSLGSISGDWQSPRTPLKRFRLRLPGHEPAPARDERR